jgi:hypothetical protein
VYHVMTLSATGEAEMPVGGSVCMRCKGKESICSHIDIVRGSTLKSRIKRRRAEVDMLENGSDVLISGEMRGTDVCSNKIRRTKGKSSCTKAE